MRPALIAATVAVILASGTVSAQAPKGSTHGGSHSGGSGSGAAQQPHGGHSVNDGREPVALPKAMATHMLANMRDHLVALQEIQEALARGDTGTAAKVAETRLGMTSLGSHGAHDIAKFMPAGMREAGTGMHRAASRFAIAATDAGVSGDLKPALEALAAVTARCNACHAGYKVK